MKIIGVYNIKGGVGKTATAVNIAHLAAKSGLRTLIWDLDPQAAATFYLRVKPKVKRSKQLLRGKGDLDGVLKGSDYPNLDLLPVPEAEPLESQGIVLTTMDGRMAFNNQVITRISRKRREIQMLIYDAAFAGSQEEQL